jgi:hypothetical protein
MLEEAEEEGVGAAAASMQDIGRAELLRSRKDILKHE